MKRLFICFTCSLIFISLSAQKVATLRIGDKSYQNDDVNINAEGIPDSGIASSYLSYNFSVENNTGVSITSYYWTYELLDNQKKYVTIKSGDSSTFTIDPVGDVSLYDLNQDGNIQGQITLEININGQKRKVFFSFYLETKPTFISVEIDAITPRPDGYFYELDVTAIYIGADYLHYDLQEEFSFEGLTQYIYEPYKAHLHFDALYMDGKTWLELKLVNTYGEAFHFIEIPKQNDTTNLPTISDVNSKKPDVKYYQAFDLQGQSILQTKEYSEITSLPHGVYLIKTIRVNRHIETHKIILK